MNHEREPKGGMGMKMDPQTEKEIQTEVEILAALIKANVSDPKVCNRMLDSLNTISHLAKGYI